MNVSDVKRRVIRRFGDANSVVITSADIYDWVNDAQLEICRQTKVLTTSTSGAASTYSTTGVALAADFLLTMRVTYTPVGGTETPLKLGSIDELDVMDVPSDNLAGNVPSVYYHSEEKLWVYPKPASTDSGVIKHIYANMATTVVADGTAIDLPALYHNDIVTYCMIRAYERDQNYRAMEKAQGEFLNAESARRSEANLQDDTYVAVIDYDWDL